MNSEEINDLLEAISRNLVWDQLEEAQQLKGDPVKFEEFFRRYHSKIVCSILFEGGEDLALLINTKDKWLDVIIEWKLKR